MLVQQVMLWSVPVKSRLPVTFICYDGMFCRAFWGFDEHFKDQANQLFSSLDRTQQKQVESVHQQQQQQSQSSVPSSNLMSRTRSVSTDRGLPLSTHRSFQLSSVMMFVLLEGARESAYLHQVKHCKH